MENKPKHSHSNVLSREQCREWILSNISHRRGEITPFKLIYSAYIKEKGRVREGESEGDASYCYTSLVPPHTFGNILSKCFPGFKRNDQTYGNLFLKKHNHGPILKRVVAKLKAKRNSDLLPYEQRKQVCKLWIDANCIKVVEMSTHSTVVYDAFIQSFSSHMYLSKSQVSVWKL